MDSEIVNTPFDDAIDVDDVESVLLEPLLDILAGPHLSLTTVLLGNLRTIGVLVADESPSGEGISPLFYKLNRKGLVIKQSGVPQIDWARVTTVAALEVDGAAGSASRKRQYQDVIKSRHFVRSDENDAKRPRLMTASVESAVAFPIDEAVVPFPIDEGTMTAPVHPDDLIGVLEAMQDQLLTFKESVDAEMYRLRGDIERLQAHIMAARPVQVHEHDWLEWGSSSMPVPPWPPS